MILGIVAAWLLLSVAVAIVVAAVGRAGLHEDRSHDYLVDRR